MKLRCSFVVSLLLLVAGSAFADTLNATSGTFTISRNSMFHSASFTFIGDRGSITGGMMDSGWEGGFGCSSMGATSCAGGASAILDGVSYPYSNSSFGFSGDTMYFYDAPGLGSFSLSVSGTVGAALYACTSPYVNCVSIGASGPAEAIVHYVERYPGFYEEDSVTGTLVPEPSSFLLLGSGAIALLSSARNKLSKVK